MKIKITAKMINDNKTEPCVRINAWKICDQLYYYLIGRISEIFQPDELEFKN